MNDFNTLSFHKLSVGNWQDCDSSFHNRGFLYGDGLFETMVFNNGILSHREFHEERLRSGCDVIGLDKTTLTSLSDIQTLLFDKFGKDTALRIRWNVFRGGQGKYTPETDLVNESLQIQSFQSATPVKSTAYFSKKIKVPRTNWSHCKTMNALVYVLANLERTQLGISEVILTNTDDMISEAGSSNIFWVKDQVFFTPSLKCSCIAGVGRRLVIEKLKHNSREIVEGEFSPRDLLNAETVFTTNITGVSFIEVIEGKTFKTFLDLDLTF